MKSKYPSNFNMVNDPIQLQQQIIHYRSEITKYRDMVNNYKKNYHYSQLDELKKQNFQLLEEKQEISKRLNGISIRMQNYIKETETNNATIERLQDDILGYKKRHTDFEKDISILNKELQSYKK
ncbi:hypothetical protein GTW56_25800 [Bacillus sp. EB93]|nr:hypothetical protein [Peribacillus frigoritolerans]